MTSTSVGPRPPAPTGRDVDEAPSRSRTSSSVVWVKSQKDWPTARNGDGVVAQTTSSTRAASSRQVDSGAAGTAIPAGRSRCSAWIAAHAGPRRQTVVDQDDGLALDGRGWPSIPVRLLASQQLAALLLGHLPDDLGGDPQAADDIVVEDEHPAAGDRPHGHLFVAGNPELAHEKDVEGTPRAAATSHATGTPPRGNPNTTTSPRPW